MVDTIKTSKKYFNLQQINHIIQIGCGGTGGFLVPQIARKLYSINTIQPERNKIRYLIIDGDNVEEKNIFRQNFISGDIGRPKAEVLANRYSAAFGIDIDFKTEFIRNSDLLRIYNNTRHGNVLIIGCIDNHNTRKIIAADFESINRYESHCWIDSGNESKSGQVFINGKTSNDRTGTNMMNIFPEIKGSEDKHPDELSCAERVSTGEQSLSINTMAANTIFNVVDAFLNLDKIYYYQVNFAVNNTTTKYFLDDYTEREKEIIANTKSKKAKVEVA